MKATGLSIIAILTLGTQAMPCNDEHPIENFTFDVSGELHNIVNGPVKDLCDRGFESGEQVLSAKVGDTTFRVTQKLDEIVHSSEGCQSGFHAIIAECVDKQNVWGGELDTDGLLFEVLRNE